MDGSKRKQSDLNRRIDQLIVALEKVWGVDAGI